MVDGASLLLLPESEEQLKGDWSVQRPQAGGLEQDKLLAPRFGVHPEVAEDPPVTKAKPEARSFRECGGGGGAVISS